jgi:Family of unknown function (DUF5681)
MDPVSKAQSSENTAKKSFGRPFQKGQSGNPGGRPKKLRITKMFERILANPSKRKEIEEAIFETLKSRRMAGVLLIREAAERTEGKVAQEVEMNVSVSLPEALSKARQRAEKE